MSDEGGVNSRLPRGARGVHIAAVIATDAPLLPHQLEKLAHRGALGLARTGSVSGISSGDLFLAFSTANAEGARPAGVNPLRMPANGGLDGLFTATAESTEGAINNALVAARTMTGANSYTVPRLPPEQLKVIPGE